MKKEYLFGEDDYHLSYVKICGKKIKDIIGYISTEMGGDPTFKISKIVFEDNSSQYVEGEHDFPYITGYNDLTFKIIDEINAEEESEEA